MLIDISQLKFFKEVIGIIHIGAHECEERLNYLIKFNSITDDDIVWIDAIKTKVEQMKNENKNIQIYNECISNIDDETVSFKITNNYQSSSILDLKEHLIEHPDIYQIDKIDMKTKTLKTFYHENGFKYDKFNFMNLDIQGAELLALKGAGDILNNVDFIYIEVNTKELYKDCPLINDIDEYLTKFYFKRFNTYLTPHGWGDAFYCKYKYKLSNNFCIEYGSDNIKINITDLTYSRRNFYNISHIPKKNEYCDAIYGDPVPGVIKNIYLTTNNQIFKFDFNYDLYIDYKTNNIYIDEVPMQYNLCIMSIFKNETMNLKTWIEHYIWQGVEHFYLIDNGSTDNPLEILREYIDKGIITYYYREQKHQQVQHYRFVYDYEKINLKTNWLCICDLDEFFFGTEEKLVNAIDKYNSYDVIYSNSFFYGSDNLINHPSDIRISNLHRTDDIKNGIKYIFKPACINSSSEIWIHWLVHEGTLQKKIKNEVFINDKIRLNHYLIQSYEYFTKIKMIRGDVSNQESENIRDIKYFEYYRDIATIFDDTLKIIIENNYK
jgi:FkbM family methyltransferase